MDPLHQTVQWSLLHDFYAGLLTEHQSEIFNLYHGMDLSLGEIAEQFDISRQAVYDILKRSEKTLLDFEERLGLVKKSLAQQKVLEKAKILLGALANDVPGSGQVQEIQALLDEL